jgi:two-component system sensor kinase FixL
VCHTLATDPDGGDDEPPAEEPPEQGGTASVDAPAPALEGALLGAAADAVVAADADCTVRYANPAAGELFGYDPGELRGRSVAQLVPDESADRLEETVRSCAGSGETDGSKLRIQGRTRDGERLELSIGPFGLEVDGTEYFAATIREVSERVQRRDDLEAKNERLTRLASVLSHDLREPLNNARAKLTLAKRTGEDEYIDEVMTVNRRMAQLVDEVLDLTTKGRPIGELESVDLAAVVEDAASALNTEGIDVEVEVTASLRADRERLRAVLENLFGNAARHAGSDTTVWVGLVDEDGFFVADDGPGIPPEDRESVFEYGFTTSSEGTGLGLSIVRDVATAHGWESRVVDSRAGGARFEFEGVEFEE